MLAMALFSFEEAPPSRLGRAFFVVLGAALMLSLWPVEPIQGPFALLATGLVAYSFLRSVRWSSLGSTRLGVR
jgi:hypothetical protein